jgi:hypothetical protein
MQHVYEPEFVGAVAALKFARENNVISEDDMAALLTVILKTHRIELEVETIKAAVNSVQVTEHTKRLRVAYRLSCEEYV